MNTDPLILGASYGSYHNLLVSSIYSYIKQIPQIIQKKFDEQLLDDIINRGLDMGDTIAKAIGLQRSSNLTPDQIRQDVKLIFVPNGIPVKGFSIDIIERMVAILQGTVSSTIKNELDEILKLLKDNKDKPRNLIIELENRMDKWDAALLKTPQDFEIGGMIKNIYWFSKLLRMYMRQQGDFNNVLKVMKPPPTWMTPKPRGDGSDGDVIGSSTGDDELGKDITSAIGDAVGSAADPVVGAIASAVITILWDIFG
jgi:hypothetical protein